MSTQNTATLLAGVAVSSLSGKDSLRYSRGLHFPQHYAAKLRVEHTLQGHNGCVNRMSWNADGSLLVSGSDDRRAIIWHYPDVDRTPLALSTEHRANIFGAQFLPCTGDRRVVTGAMDDTVQLHDLESSPATGGPGRGGARARQQAQPGMRRQVGVGNVQLVMPRTKVYLSHKDRVKDIETEPLNPHNFWSGGEDGVVRQYDTRAPNQQEWASPTVLVQVRDGHRTVQVKSLDINKAHPHLLAVAGSDPYIRLYDRRRLGPGSWKRRGSTPAVLALAPPHLPLPTQARHGRAHATYVSFSNKGDKLVTTYHGDHAYAFDITSAGGLAAAFAAPTGPGPGLAVTAGAWAGPGPVHRAVAAAAEAEARGSGGGGGSEGGTGSPRSGGGSPLPPRAEEAKARGNSAMFERRWPAAVAAFGEALHWAPGAPLLYALRAEALLGRGWVGDAALALRDCDTAVGLDAGFSRAYLRRIQALQALQQFQCALTAADEYRRRFPGRAAEDVAALAAQLRGSVEERRRTYEARRQQQERRRAQRAQEALARAPRRQAGLHQHRSPGPAVGSGGASTGGSSAPTAAATPPAPITPVQPAVTAAATAPNSGPAAAVTAGVATAAATTTVEAAEAAAVHDSPMTEAAGADADAASPSDSEDFVGPPPPPPTDPYPGDLAAAGSSGGGGAAAAATAVPGPTTPLRTRLAAVAGGLEGVWEGSEEGTADEDTAITDRATTVGAGSTDAATADSEEGEPSRGAAAGPSARPGAAPETSGPRPAGDGGSEGLAAEAEAEEEEEDDDEDEAGAARSESGGDSDLESLPGEADPDEELFLQYYARAMELVEGCAGGSAAARASSAPPGSAPRGAWAGSEGGRRMTQRYVGQCNVQTDIKEACFVGAGDAVVAAGSDCGRVFLYDAASGAVLRALTADEDVANCVQCHPTLPVLATSGIENVVRLWAPSEPLPSAAALPELQEELAAVVARNQERMREAPSMLRASALQQALQENPQLWHLLMSQLYRRGMMPGGRGRPGEEAGAAGEEDEDEGEDERPEVSCRMA
ncbi:hypothetical protein HYH03_004132 [Edaphochlamys debaryana]|uniref:WD and tetratricopeptide repeats protein 1 n=1 Tax=Edaphochlamys debaryana TaxID=47281 RepID=A0A835Y898_9CHLO|nr:hypothetical protein HYH03_004132 [Edaphochlamys debaryana]|eukprot:KAG2497866.1 hypothetical protein HYH03_004132 [Edaphochlamys debaryana]